VQQCCEQVSLATAHRLQQLLQLAPLARVPLWRDRELRYLRSGRRRRGGGGGGLRERHFLLAMEAKTGRRQSLLHQAGRALKPCTRAVTAAADYECSR